MLILKAATHLLARKYFGILNLQSTWNSEMYFYLFKILLQKIADEDVLRSLLNAWKWKVLFSWDTFRVRRPDHEQQRTRSWVQTFKNGCTKMYFLKNQKWSFINLLPKYINFNFFQKHIGSLALQFLWTVWNKPSNFDEQLLFVRFIIITDTLLDQLTFDMLTYIFIYFLLFTFYRFYNAIVAGKWRKNAKEKIKSIKLVKE